MALCILPSGLIAQRYGRLIAFQAGTALGVLSGVSAMAAMIYSSFTLLCLSTIFGGAYAAVVLSFRFAATDGVAPDRQPRALSMVMAGGIAAGVVGPQLITHTMNLSCGLDTHPLRRLSDSGAAALAGTGSVVGCHASVEEVAGGRALVTLFSPSFCLPLFVVPSLTW